MTRVGAPPAAAPAAPEPAEHPKLRAAARQLTGVFAQQLFKAMRETVPQGEGVVSGGSAEEMFTGMLDEHLAGAGPAAHGAPGAHAAGDGGAAFTRGLADAVYRRLRLHAGPADTPAAGAAGVAAGVTAAPAAASLSHAAPPAPLAPPDRR